MKTRIHNTLVMQLTGIIGGVLHPVSQITALTQNDFPFLSRIYTEDKFAESLGAGPASVVAEQPVDLADGAGAGDYRCSDHEFFINYKGT